MARFGVITAYTLAVALAASCASGAAVKQPVTFSNISFTSVPLGTFVRGEVTNRVNRVLEVAIEVALYDKGGQIVGLATGRVAELHPEQTKVFEAVAIVGNTDRAVKAVPQIKSTHPACP